MKPLKFKENFWDVFVISLVLVTIGVLTLFIGSDNSPEKGSVGSFKKTVSIKHELVGTISVTITTVNEPDSSFSKKVSLTSFFFKRLASLSLIFCGLICLFIFLYWNHKKREKEYFREFEAKKE